ncbi:hypothetical protein EI94DRAFT_1769101 [Lactarius quietus]|nr:hypothetical protein EI94DRAFT_1769101 [Lactarius quietus]
MTNPLVGPSALRDIVDPQFHQNNFPEELYIKNELNIRLDKDDQICRLNLTPAGCPLGPLHCHLRHTVPSTLNFQPPKQLPTHPRDRERLATVCKHWLRGLCKKGDACEFLHEYNLRRMPECWWFAKYGYCSAGDECLYAHPKERKVECPDYKRGFCKLGPTCPRKHVRRVACQSYLTGYCPLGPDCPKGHMHSHLRYVQSKTSLPPPKAYEHPEPPSQRELGPHLRAMVGAPGNAPPHGLGQPGPRRNLDEVLCFKCGEKGHYANHCRNRNVPGNRGGIERRRYNGEDY